MAGSCLHGQEGVEAGSGKMRVLVVTESVGFRHGPVTRRAGKLSVAEQTLKELAEKTGAFTVYLTQNTARDFTKERLNKTDVVFFYTCGNLRIPKETLDWFLNVWLKEQGHGFVGVHSATDTYTNYRPYWEMIGGTFNGHPWGSGSTVTITVHDTEHPVARPWGKEFTIQDEIYWFRNWQPEKVRVLMSLNMAKTALKKPRHVPVAWVKKYGKGRVAYISLGHREDVWANPKYRASLVAALKWAAGALPGDATPNPELSAEEERKAKEACEQASQ
jgi:hypothetical protein